jgi:hypothetical protein
MPEAAFILALTAVAGWGMAGWAAARGWRRAYLSTVELRDLLIRERDG